VSPRGTTPHDEWYPPARPRPVDGGLRARSRRGEIGQSWWSARFIDGLEALGIGGRLARGKRYARAGQVIDLRVQPGSTTALVQGSRPRPYRVRIGLTAFGKTEWARVEQALADNAWYTAKLLAGEMPTDIDEVFAAAGLSLLPAGARDLSMDCSCPDFAVPCKHLAATLYLLAESFDDDPFQIIAMRGRSRQELLENLSARRGGTVPGAVGTATLGTPPLSDSLDTFWVSPGRPPAPPPAAVAVDSLLDQVPPGGIIVRGRGLVDLIRPVYRVLGEPAATGVERRRGSPTDP
jgi:uncharacterized Zn finger protein